MLTLTRAELGERTACQLLGTVVELERDVAAGANRGRGNGGRHSRSRVACAQRERHRRGDEGVVRWITADREQRRDDILFDHSAARQRRLGDDPCTSRCGNDDQMAPITERRKIERANLALPVGGNRCRRATVDADSVGAIAGRRGRGGRGRADPQRQACALPIDPADREADRRRSSRAVVEQQLWRPRSPRTFKELVVHAHAHLVAADRRQTDRVDRWRADAALAAAAG